METTQLCKNDVRASNLLFVGQIFSVTVLVVGAWLHIPAQPLTNLIVGKYVVITLLHFGHFYAIRRGEKWAKYLLLALYAITILICIVQYDNMFRYTPFFYAADYVVRLIIYGLALIILFKPSWLNLN